MTAPDDDAPAVALIPDARALAIDAAIIADEAVERARAGQQFEAGGLELARTLALASIALSLADLEAVIDAATAQGRPAPPGADYLADLDRLAQAHESRRSRR